VSGGPDHARRSTRRDGRRLGVEQRVPCGDVAAAPDRRYIRWLNPGLLGELESSVGECGLVASLRHGIEYRIDEGAVDERAAAIRNCDPRTVQYDRALLARLSWDEDDDGELLRLGLPTRPWRTVRVESRRAGRRRGTPGTHARPITCALFACPSRTWPQNSRTGRRATRSGPTEC